MLRKADIIATYGLLVAGGIHTTLTTVFKPAGGEEALWFAGSGLSLVLLGALNHARHCTGYPEIVRLCRGANTVGTLYMCFVTAVVPAPHVVVVLIFTGTALVGSMEPVGRSITIHRP